MDQGGRGPAGVEGPLGKPGLPGLGNHMVLISDGTHNIFARKITLKSLTLTTQPTLTQLKVLFFQCHDISLVIFEPLKENGSLWRKNIRFVIALDLSKCLKQI